MENWGLWRGEKQQGVCDLPKVMGMENWDSWTGEKQQGVCDLPKVRDQPHSHFCLVFAGFLIKPSLSPSPGAAHPGLGNTRTSEAGGARKNPKLLP